MFLSSSHHNNIKNKLGKDIIPACNIHTVENETLDGGPKGEVENKN